MSRPPGQSYRLAYALMQSLTKHSTSHKGDLFKRHFMTTGEYGEYMDGISNGHAVGLERAFSYAIGDVLISMPISLSPSHLPQCVSCSRILQ